MTISNSKDWRATLVAPDASLRDVIATIDAAELQIAVVIDAEEHLLGVITDGDVRRALLRGLTLTTPAAEVMTLNPTTVTPDMRPTAIENLMLERDLRHIPVVDASGVLVGLALPGTNKGGRKFNNQVFLMAGGLGSRLGDLTRDTPKPMLRVGGKPILETILEGFLAQGFYRFTIAVNYKSDLIQAYFGDGSRWGAEVSYLHEAKRLGTCGALSLLEKTPEQPFFVMNADLLTKVNFGQMLEFHTLNSACATMAVREYDVQIPFGVVDTEDSSITALTEKPVQRYFVNAGVYVLEPDCLDHIPENDMFDMTQLFNSLLTRAQKAVSFPVHEYWLDIGRLSDFEQANSDYHELWAEPGEARQKLE